MDSSSTFLDVPKNLEYIIKDSFTENHFFGTKITNCSDIWLQDNKRFVAVKHECVQSCDPIRFE